MNIVEISDIGLHSQLEAMANGEHNILMHSKSQLSFCFGSQQLTAAFMIREVQDDEHEEGAEGEEVLLILWDADFDIENL